MQCRVSVQDNGSAACVDNSMCVKSFRTYVALTEMGHKEQHCRGQARNYRTNLVNTTKYSFFFCLFSINEETIFYLLGGVTPPPSRHEGVLVAIVMKRLEGDAIASSSDEINI